MAKSTTENTMVLPAVLAFLFVFAPMVFVGCKKEDQSQETQQGVGSKETETVSTPESLEPSDQVDTAGPSEKIGLRILYAGLPNTDRAKDFVQFLTAHFKQVETTDYNAFTGSHTADFDVAIIDHDGADTRAPRPNVSRRYARATITVGVPGAFICSQLSLKTGYL